MFTKNLLSAFALLLALGVAAPALADRFDDPMDYGVGFEDGTDAMTGEQNLEDLVSTRA